MALTLGGEWISTSMSSDLTNKLPPGSGGLIQVWAKKIDGDKLDMLGEKKRISICRCYFVAHYF